MEKKGSFAKQEYYCGKKKHVYFFLTHLNMIKNVYLAILNFNEPWRSVGIPYMVILSR